MRVSLIRSLTLTAAAVLCATSVAQKTINVPSDQPTIQAGINAASTGDTVLIAPGTYYENIDFKGKAITVTSSKGAASTILDGSTAAAPAVRFSTHETRASILSNLTIQAGGVEYGTAGASTYGGIYIADTSPSIINNVITHNHCFGIQSNGAPLIQGNEIDNTLDKNGCLFAGGAAVYLQQDLLYDNSPHPVPIVIGNLIQDNTQSGREDAGGNGGAGIASWIGLGVIENNIIRNNITGGQGAGIHLEANGGLVIGNLVYNNQAGGGGGGLDINGFYNNFGVYPTFNAFIANNTFANNTYNGSYSDGISNNYEVDQIYFGSYGFIAPTFAFVNNIVSGNSSRPAIQCGWYGLASADTDSLLLDHNLFYNAGGPIGTSLCADHIGTYGNISADPRFVNPSANDFHLAPGSPAIDTGNSSALAFLSTNGVSLSTDLDGNGRLQDATGKGYPVIDIGAYEFGGLPEAGATTLLLTPSTFEGSAGSPFTFTIKAFSPLGTPTGPVSLFEDTTSNLGTMALDAGGNASFVVKPTPGIHHFVAQYPGQGVFTPSVSVQIIVVVSKYSPVITIVSSMDPSFASQSVTFTVTASSPEGYVPSPLTLTDNYNNTLATLVPDSSGVATYTTSSLTTGPHTITAAYAGDATHNSSSASVYQQVLDPNDTSGSLTAVPSPSILNSPVAFTARITSAGGTAPTGSVTFTYGSTVLGTQTLTPQGASSTATISYSALPVGFDNITATYTPTGTFHASTSTLYQQVINGYATATTVQTSLSPSSVGRSITFTAHVAAQTSGNGVPTGSITFTDGTTTLATQPLDSNNNAAISLSTLTVGAHTITATYIPTGSFAGSSATLTQTVDGIHPTATINALLTVPQTYGKPIGFFVNVTGPAGSPAPTGTVTFLVDGATLGTSTLTATGLATYSTSTLSAGTHTATCTYSGDAAYNSISCNSITVTVTLAPARLVLTAAPSGTAPALTPVTFSATLIDSSGSSTPIANATVAFSIDSSVAGTTTTTASGVAVVTTSTLTVGSHTITAAFAGDSNHSAAASNSLTELITALPTVVTLAAAPNPGYQNQPVTLTATVSAPLSTSQPIGSVTFYEGATPLGTATIPASQNSATFTTSSLAPGNHTITAAYTPGSTSFLPSTSAVLTLTILPQGYTLTTDPPSLTIQTEHHRSMVVSLTSIGGLTGSFKLSCGPLPEAASCSWGQTTVQLPSNGTVSTQLTLDTDVVLNFKSALDQPTAFPKGVYAPITLALLLPFAFIPTKRRTRFSKLLALVLLSAAALSVTACSSKYPDHTPPGAYSILLTATPSDPTSTQPQHRTTITLSVTP